MPLTRKFSAIPSESANHTEGFAKAARSVEAHEAAMLTMKGLALTAFRVINDDDFWFKVRLARRICAIFCLCHIIPALSA